MLLYRTTPIFKITLFSKASRNQFVEVCGSISSHLYKLIFFVTTKNGAAFKSSFLGTAKNKVAFINTFLEMDRFGLRGD
jgi:hypothetical protein